MNDLDPAASSVSAATARPTQQARTANCVLSGAVITSKTCSQAYRLFQTWDLLQGG
jgi:hypothetical protein